MVSGECPNLRGGEEERKRLPLRIVKGKERGTLKLVRGEEE